MLKLSRNQNIEYVIINLSVSAYSFVRSFIFMRVLDLKELGVISLVQTVFMLMGLLQFGILNGGYRIVSLGKREEFHKVNNTFFSYILILTILATVFFVGYLFVDLDFELTKPLMFVALAFGIMTLINNWLHNALIGEQRLKEVNKLNIISYLLALICLPLAYYWGFTGAIIAITIQPLSFVGLCIIRNREFVPKEFTFKKDYIRYILSFGFIPFLGGIFVQLITQLERWSINGNLGVEALGGFYLVFIYTSLYQLVPTSINAIFFPKGVKSYSEERYDDFKHHLRNYYIVLLGYGFMIALATIFLMEPVVELVFPQHLPGVALVYIVLPGLVIQSLTEPLGLILNSAVILRPMLITSSLSLVLNVVFVLIYTLTDSFSLESMAALRTITGVFTFVAYIVTFIIIRNRIPFLRKSVQK